MAGIPPVKVIYPSYFALQVRRRRLPTTRIIQGKVIYNMTAINVPRGRITLAMIYDKVVKTFPTDADSTVVCCNF
jgi:hypothetical protein